ncbi:hypothetical protein [Dongshaea marina]|uniref:hypothetical protein n=1 Tax=Dongshaea marina TaxID=2047966 RepID=UPI000D3E0835|nr:hypothetical protein [Dongshaea marina]
MQGFKKCSMCSHQWKTRAEFIADPYVILIGYKADFQNLDEGLFLFTHQTGECQSTLALEVGGFKDLYHGALYTERKAGGPECPLYCQDVNQLVRCQAKCECAYIREVMQIFRSEKDLKNEEPS